MFIELNPISGDINIELGDGNDQVHLLSTFGGQRIDVRGNDGNDTVNLNTTGTRAVANIRLDGGDDRFQLSGLVSLNDLRVDFGAGQGQFINNFGSFDFGARLINLLGYDAIFDQPTGNLDLIQREDQGDLLIDDGGINNGIRFSSDGNLVELTDANDFRVILLANSATASLTADFDSVRDGNTTFQMRDGSRELFLTGDSNRYTGLLRVEAADGIQDIHLAVNAPLDVTGTVIVNTRGASDAVVADNAVSISEAFLLRSVNTFVNNHGLNVGGDMNVITVLEDENTRLINNDSFSVGGNLTYLGGGGVDSINFKTNGAMIGGYTYIDIASASFDGRQNVLLTGGFSTTSLVIDGDTAVGGNYVLTDASTLINGGLVVVNFGLSSTVNTAIFRGTYSGAYSSYRGGSSSDFVTFGANVANGEFAGITGDGNDTMTVEESTNLDFLFADFGQGSDSLLNEFGTEFPFDSLIAGL